MDTRSDRVLLGARGGPLGDAVHDHASHARSDDWSGLPQLHGSVPSLCGPRLGQGIQLRVVAWDVPRPDLALVLLWDDAGSTSFVLTAIGLGIVLVGVIIVSNAWKTPTYKLILGWDPEALPADWEAGRQRYFAINWIQMATTRTAFALFLVALGYL